MIRNSIFNSMRNHAQVRQATKPTFFAKAKTPKTGEVYIYEEVGESWYGGISAQGFADAMRELADVEVLDIYINSPGGSVFDGIAIYEQLLRHKARKIVHIDALAASIATIIAMAGDEIRMSNAAQFMIHDPSGVCFGTAEDMTKYADTLRSVKDTLVDTYAKRTKRTTAEIGKWMADETWMRASVALERGFIDKIEGSETEASAVITPLLNRYKNTPEELRSASRDQKLTLARMQMRAQQIKNSRASPPNK